MGFGDSFEHDFFLRRKAIELLLVDCSFWFSKFVCLCSEACITFVEKCMTFACIAPAYLLHASGNFYCLLAWSFGKLIALGYAGLVSFFRELKAQEKNLSSNENSDSPNL